MPRTLPPGSRKWAVISDALGSMGWTIATVCGDEVDGGDGAVYHDGDNDAGLGGWRTIEDPDAADLADAVVEGGGAVAVLAQGPAKASGVEGGGDGYVRGGDFEVADLAVA